HVNRLKFIWDSACFERILVRNFDLTAHTVMLGINFEADFVDLFEVRGHARAERGQVSIERSSGASITLRYLGLDEVERVTNLLFEPRPIRLDNATALFELPLGPGEAMRVLLRIALTARHDRVGIGCG